MSTKAGPGVEEDLKELEEAIASLYYPGRYDEGEELCLAVLEELDPDSVTANLYLTLNLAAKDHRDEALEMAAELPPRSIIPALEKLAFGAGTPAEEALYRELIRLGQAAGLKRQLQRFFSTAAHPPRQYQPVTPPPTWMRGADLQTSFMLDLKRHDPRYKPVFPEPREREDRGHERKLRARWEWVAEDELDDMDPNYEYEVVEIEEETDE